MEPEKESGTAPEAGSVPAPTARSEPSDRTGPDRTLRGAILSPIEFGRLREARFGNDAPLGCGRLARTGGRGPAPPPEP